MFLAASKNHRGEKYIDHQTLIKDGEVVNDTNKFDMQRRINEADLQITSVGQAYLHIGFNQMCRTQTKHILLSVVATIDSATRDRTGSL